MASVVCLHGIGQAAHDARFQRDRWVGVLRRCLDGGSITKLERNVAVPYYAKRYGQAEFLGPDERSMSASEVQFVLDSIGSGIVRGPRTIQDYELGPPGLLPPPIIRAVRRLDARWGVGQGFIALRALREVYDYLYGDRTRVTAILREVLTSETSLVIAHSLGSVIAADQFNQIAKRTSAAYPNLITIGSPLAWASIAKAVSLDGLQILPNWHNIFDPWDVVTAGVGLEPNAQDLEVRNRRRDPHALLSYFEGERVRRLVGSLMEVALG